MIFFGLCPSYLFGQLNGEPIKGVVWDVPREILRAEADLYAMQRLGVEAVRTRPIQQERLLWLADTLGIQVFQELPVRRLPAQRLADTLHTMQAMLSRMLAVAQRHVSTRHFGLTELSDTSDPIARAYIRELAQLVRSEGPPGSQSYYITSFIEADCCWDEVDFVLLHVRDNPDPTTRITHWQRIHQKPIGLADLGTWIQEGHDGGYQQKHTLANQARYLEDGLRATLFDVQVPVFFIERWRDRVQANPVLAPGPELATERRYGLVNAAGEPRPAYEVAEGFFTGKRQVFAFDAGVDSNSLPVWRLIMMGWLLVAIVGLLFGFTLWVPQIVRRYFFSHGFYLETIRQGRAIEHGLHLVLWGVQAAMAGLIATTAFQIGARTYRASLLFEQMNGWWQQMVNLFFYNPMLMLLVVAGIYILLSIGYVILIKVWGGKVRFQQALMIIIWPRWYLLVVMTGALICLSREASWGVYGIGLVLLGWVVFEWLGITRMLIDAAQVTRKSILLTCLVGWSIPVFAIGMLTAILWFRDAWPEVGFLWHLIVRA